MLYLWVLVCSFNWVYVNLAWRNGWWHTRWGLCWVEVQAHWRMGCCSDSRWHWACCICHVGRNPPARLPKSPLEATGLSTLSVTTFYIAVLLRYSFLHQLFEILPGSLHSCQQSPSTKCNDPSQRSTGRSCGFRIWWWSYSKYKQNIWAAFFLALINNRALMCS